MPRPGLDDEGQKPPAAPRKPRARKPAAGAVAPPAETVWPAYWLPAPLRRRLIGEGTLWHETRANGAAGTVVARRPVFTHAEWAEIVSELRAAREKAPRGAEYWARFQTALAAAARRLTDRSDPAYGALVAALSSFTGYSPGMVEAALQSPELWDVEQMTAALRYQPDKVCSVRWRQIPGLPGRIRFFPRHAVDKLAGYVPVSWEMPLFRAESRPETVAGFDDGTVPGGGLMMAFLALAATLRGEAPLPRPVPPPVVLLRGSEQEPLLTPAVLSAIEEIDPGLVAMVAVGGWDDGDAGLQRQILEETDLVLASAGAEDLASLEAQAAALRHSPRIHAHGHKAGFTVISRETLQLDWAMDGTGWTPPGGAEVIDIVALLGALDSAYWDQNGCLSSRIHFVEKADPADDLPAEYARRLVKRLRQLSQVMPRGSWPLRHLHDPFDRYKTIEGTDRWGNGLRVLSEYDDPFVVVLDERTGKEARLDANVFASMAGECRTRVVIVRPVDDIMDVPWRYLPMLPRQTLQSVSVAFGRPGRKVDRAFLDFATACGARGVTAIHPVGRAAFPRLAHSWDGLLPLDVVGRRPPGRFCTFDFDSPFDAMIDSYRDHLALLAKLPPVDRGGPARAD